MTLFPPGRVFFPPEELLLTYFLYNKIHNEAPIDLDGAEVIKEWNLYDLDAFELPESMGFLYGDSGREKHWYCFTHKVTDDDRHARGGFWQKRGVVANVIDDNGDLGTKTLFVFHIGNSPRNCTGMDRVMYEYALADNPSAAFIVCRIFDYPTDDDVSSCFGPTSNVVNRDRSNDEDDVTSQNPLRDGGEQDGGRAVTAPDYVGPQDAQQERLVDLPDDCGLFIDDVDYSVAIWEGDFIELSDLF